MKPVEMLNQVKELLGMEVQLTEEVKLAQIKLENGTVLEAESFESEQPVFIVTEDERVPLPMGQYDLEDGKILVIEEEGIIKEISEAKAAEESPEEIEQEIQAEEESPEEEKEDKQEMNYVTKEELNSAVDEIKAMIDEIRGPKEEEMSETEQLGLAMTEKLSKEESVELKEETEKINHSPESKETKSLNLYAKKRQHTIKDRVLNKILNLDK
jgi:hypothetical protein